MDCLHHYTTTRELIHCMYIEPIYIYTYINDDNDNDNDNDSRNRNHNRNCNRNRNRNLNRNRNYNHNRNHNHNHNHNITFSFAVQVGKGRKISEIVECSREYSVALSPLIFKRINFPKKRALGRIPEAIFLTTQHNDLIFFSIDRAPTIYTI